MHAIPNRRALEVAAAQAHGAPGEEDDVGADFSDAVDNDLSVRDVQARLHDDRIPDAYLTENHRTKMEHSGQARYTASQCRDPGPVEDLCKEGITGPAQAHGLKCEFGPRQVRTSFATEVKGHRDICGQSLPQWGTLRMALLHPAPALPRAEQNPLSGPRLSLSAVDKVTHRTGHGVSLVPCPATPAGFLEESPMRQWLQSRRSRRTVPVDEWCEGAVDLDAYPGMDELLDAGDMGSARALLVKTEPSATPEHLARIELQLRHEAFKRAAVRASAAPWPPTTHTVLSGDLPEIPADELTIDTLIAGVRHHGALLVRGLFTAQACKELRDMIDATMSAHARNPSGGDARFNTPLCDISGQPLSPKFRKVNFDEGGRPTADSPAAAARVLAEFDRIGITELISGYLGEQPALSLEKWTLRKVPPTANSSWHQDGAFLGTDKHTVNLWVALSDCGEHASGLDLIPQRFDRILPTGTEGAYFHWDISQTVVDHERGGHPVASPVFTAGDAVFFDQFLVHRTGVKEDLTQTRYALESWFFTPTSFPGHYEGLLL